MAALAIESGQKKLVSENIFTCPIPEDYLQAIFCR
jgi:hypothetical protein